MDKVLYTLDKFSIDYDVFNQTWYLLCNEHIPSQPTPKKILIMSSFEDTNWCDALTAEGFCIRLYKEFMPCKGNCNHAIATKELHDFLVTKGWDRPWNDKCSSCLEENNT